MIHDGEDALLVDIKLCLSAFKTSLWLRESKSLVMVIGYLEHCPVRPGHAWKLLWRGTDELTVRGHNRQPCPCPSYTHTHPM